MKARPGLLAGMILLVGGWIYWPALHGGWIWDDLAEIPNNPVLSDPAGLGKIWTGASSPDYFPLKTTVQWVEWHLWGSQALGYHWTSLALHSLSALLLWRLLRQLGVRQAWVGGLLFMVHPLAVESVAWISELKNTLSLPPLLLAMSAYVRFDERRSDPKAPGAWRSYALSLGWFLAALLCKSTVVMLPVVLLLYGWWRRGRIGWKDVRSSLPFFAVALALGLVTVWFQEHRAANGVDLEIGGMQSRLAAAGMAVAFYLGKSVIPFGLMPNYPRWSVIPPSIGQFWPWAALAAIGIWLGTRRAPWARAAMFGAAWFLVNLVPVLGLIPMSYLRISWVADHFAYVSLAAVAGLAAAGWSALADAPETGAAAPAWFQRPLFLNGLLAAVAAAFAIQSQRYAGIFHDERRFWTFAAAHNPGSWVAQNDLGLTVAQEGRLPEAIAHYEAALRLHPDYSEAQLNLGNALLQAGRYAEAVGHYDWVVRQHPGHADTYAYLGLAQARMGRLPEAISNYQTALRLNPKLPETENNLGNALARLGRVADAQAAYARALQLRPNYAEAERNWGNLLSAAGQLAAAAAHYRQAISLEPDDPQAHYQLANALANAGQLAQAIPEYGEALRLRPDYAAAHANLGLALTGAGRLDSALAELREAVRLDPNDPEAHAYYGYSLAKAGRLPEAIDQYERALQLTPGDADVHYNLAMALRAAGREREAQAELEAAARLGGGR
jgi:tetratricopeptide (TPR) repeat protein